MAGFAGTLARVAGESRLQRFGIPLVGYQADALPGCRHLVARAETTSATSREVVAPSGVGGRAVPIRVRSARVLSPKCPFAISMRNKLVNLAEVAIWGPKYPDLYPEVRVNCTLPEDHNAVKAEKAVLGSPARTRGASLWHSRHPAHSEPTRCFAIWPAPAGS